MKTQQHKLKLTILLSLMVSCAGGAGIPFAYAETLNIASQADYNALNYFGYICPTGSYSGNTVIIGTIGGGTVPAFSNNPRAYGAGVANNNELSIGANNVTNNTLTINSGSNILYAMGGVSATGANSGNTIIVNGGTITGLAAGGWSLGDTGTATADGTGSVIHNTATMNGGTAAMLAGGWSNNGIANDNTTIVNGGTINRVIGGKGASQATGNEVSFTHVPSEPSEPISVE